MSRSKTEGHVVPATSLRLNLDLHGFELVEGAPERVVAEVVRGVGGRYDLDVETSDEASWRVELHVKSNGTLAVGAIFEEGTLVADATDDEVPGLTTLPEWLRYTVRHISGEVTGV